MQLSLREHIVPSIRTLPISSTVKLALLSISPLKPELVTVSLPMGLKAYVPTKWLTHVWSNILHIFYHRDYEGVVEVIPRDGWKVMDVGSFIGLWTLRAAKLVGAKGRVIALEPNPLCYRLTRANVMLNSLDNVVVLNYALDSEARERRLYIAPNIGNSSFVKRYVDDMGGCVGSMEVETITLDDIFDKLDVKALDLVKIDVEGYEDELLYTICQYMAKGIVKRVVIEVHRNVVDEDKVVDALEKAGCKVYLYDVGLEVQTFVYALRTEP
ncbi:MAG: hypothetical protein DRN15_06070 [Thermoprotei archaeon]|nr:MAG: hypothetical protein DRM97_07140 [Thermoprotei archaeon]RLF23504.1 MAG: hypothetical protein DRN15_06070 [Thermoprotei archaeon]